MRYKTKVTVVTGKKTYQPGEVLPADITGADLTFLKSKKFVEPADIPSASMGEETAPEDGGRVFEGFDVMEPSSMKSPEEIRRMRAKKDVAAYAASVGLDLGEDYEEKSLKELQEEVINFQEEKLEEGLEDDYEGE